MAVTQYIDFGLPYPDAVLKDEPVFAYLLATSTSTLYYNIADKTASAANNGTKSSDVYEAPSLMQSSFLKTPSAYFDCDSTTGRPYVSIPWFAERQINAGDPLSFECLFKLNSLPSHPIVSFDTFVGGSVLYASHQANTASKGWQVRVSGSGIVLGYYNSGAVFSYSSTTVSLSTDTLYHLVITTENDTSTSDVNYYLNGVLINTTPLDNGGSADTINENTVTETGSIGSVRTNTVGDEGTDGFYFNGQIQAVCQYDYILTPTQVTTHYESINRMRFFMEPNADNQRYIDVVSAISTAFYNLNVTEQGSGSGGFGDQSPNNNQGTAVGSIQSTANPLSDTGSSPIFLSSATNGKSYVSITSDGSLSIPSSATFMGSASLFISTNDASNNRLNQAIIFSLGDTAVAGGQGMHFYVNTNKMKISCFNGSTFDQTIEAVYADEGFTDTPLDSINHYAVTIQNTNGGTVKFYRDGVLIKTTTITTAVPSWTASPKSYIGAFNDLVDAQGAYCIIDDVSYIASELSEQEIKGYYKLSRSLHKSSDIDLYNYRWTFDSDSFLSSSAPVSTSKSHEYLFDSSYNDNIGSANFSPTDAGGFEYSPSRTGTGTAIRKIQNDDDELNVTFPFSTFNRVSGKPQSFTLTFWWRFDNDTIVDAGGDYSMMFRLGENGSNSGIIIDYFNPVDASASLRVLVGDATSYKSVATGTRVVNNGYWNHLGLVIDNDGTVGKVELYVNGCQTRLKTAFDQKVHMIDEVAGLFIRSGGSDHLVNGDIEDLVIWNGKLTAEDMLSLYGGEVIKNQTEVAEWKLNNPTNAYSSEVGGSAFRGLFRGSPIQRELSFDSATTSALTLNGTDQSVDILCSIAPGNGNNVFTICGWAKQSTENPVTLFASYNDSTVGSTNLGPAGVRFWTTGAVVGMNTGTVSGTDYLELNNPIPVGDNKWHFYALRYDGVDVRFYMDGVVVASSPWTLGAATPPYYFQPMIGAWEGNPTIGGKSSNLTKYYSQGAVDDIRIYQNRVLDTPDIAYLFRTRIRTKPNDMIAWWQLNTDTQDVTDNDYNWENEYGTPTYTDLGWRDTTALTLNGTDQAIEFTYANSAWARLQTFSVSFFMKWDGSAVGVNILSYERVNNTPQSTGGWRLRITNGGDLQFVTWSGVGTLDAQNTTVTQPSGNPYGVLPANKWVHIVATRTPTSQKLFVDGELISDETPSGSIDYSDTNLLFQLGCRNREGVTNERDDYFPGLINDLRFYDRELQG